MNLEETLKNMEKISLDCEEEDSDGDLDGDKGITSNIVAGTFLEIKIGPPNNERDAKQNGNVDQNEVEDISLECLSDTSSQMEFPDQNSQHKSYPEAGIVVHEIESKYLEEQANLKRQVEDKDGKCTQLAQTLQQKEEQIGKLERDKHLLEKEKSMLKRESEISNREKETAVIRYATLEKKLIDMKATVDSTEKKFKDSQRELDLLNGKIRNINAEKTRICNMLDVKCHELKNSQKDCDKYKNDLSSLEMKSKWNLVKLKQEMELKVSAEKKVEELNLEITKLNAIPRADDKSIPDEQQVMEQQATLILLKHGNEEKEKKIEQFESKISNLQAELKDISAKYSECYNDRENLRFELETHKDEHEDLQSTLDREVLKVAELQAKVSDFETLKTQYSIEKENGQRRQKELNNLKQNYDEQTAELGKLRIKENELLQFNKDLTERTVKLQNDISLNNSKSIALGLDNETMKKEKKSYDDRIRDLENDLATEKHQRNEERLLLTRHISEKTKAYENVQKKLDSCLGDLDAIKKKHSQTIKELNRELMQLRKKHEQQNNELTSLSRKSSIDTTGDGIVASAFNEQTGKFDHHSSRQSISSGDIESPTEGNNHDFPSIQIKEPSKKILIDRIVRLQNVSAKQNEKIDFLENHSANLAIELQKKQKLIQYYMLRDQTGALASSKSDRNKAELVKYGGIMSAIYSGIKNKDAPDMTLDLSLEINRKLQAVLEDTLLKNITLKENLDTLGLEIDKLTRQVSHSPRSSVGSTSTTPNINSK